MNDKTPAGSSGKNTAITSFRGSWLNTVATIVIFGALAVAWYFWPASPERPEVPVAHGSLPAPTRSEPAPEPTAATPPRPTWLRLNRAVTATDLLVYERLLVSAEQIPVRRFGGPVTDPVARDRILAARDRVVRVLAVEHAWEWAEVRAVVQEIGNRIPLLQVETSHEEGSMVMGWAPLEQAFIFWSRKIQSSSDYDLEGTIAHEATHVVFDRRLQRYSGYSRRELAIISELCRDVGVQMELTDEMNAMLNQAAYQYRPGTSDVQRDSGQEDIPLTIAEAARALRGDRTAMRDFTENMMRYVTATRYAGAHRPGIQRCWPSVSTRGPNAGRLFLASDVAPRVVPYLEIVPTL